MPGQIDRWALRKTLKMDGPALFHIREKLRERRNTLFAATQQEALKLSSSSTDAANVDSYINNELELQHYLTHLVRYMNEEFKEIEQMHTTMKEDPTYPMLSAQPPCEFIRANKVEIINITTCVDRMFAPPMVYGFSFRLKKWGSFSVGGFTDIVFNDSAYDVLVMDASIKDLTENLVREHLQEARKDKEPEDYIKKLDPIVNKGEGCVFLCYGPPGTEKTLTVESLSEKLHCALWSLNVSELGITPSILETTSVKVMDVAALWGAILLLNEADVHLEWRSSSDLTRNAMTAVFLKQLEYYRGVIFLTTNRDTAFDEAISSRIAHQFCIMQDTTQTQRSAMWSTLFCYAGLKTTPEVLAEFSMPEINGREIRNIMQTAQTLARSKKKRNKTLRM